MRRLALTTLAIVLAAPAWASCWTPESGRDEFAPGAIVIGQEEIVAGSRVCEIGSVERSGGAIIYRASCNADLLGDIAFVEIVETNTQALVSWDDRPAQTFLRCGPEQEIQVREH